MNSSDASSDLETADIRPLVARQAGNRGVWIFAGALVLAAVGLFSSLEARRASISSPAISIPAGATGASFAPPPELAIPSAYSGYPMTEGATLPEQMPSPAQAALAAPAPRPQPVYMPSSPVYSGPIAGASAPVQQGQVGPAYAYQAAARGPAPAAEAKSDSGDERVQASRFANPATTVPKGTVIQVVLETALDSNRAGFARAVVSRDVSSFDGSRVLIAKGSKLFGEYKSDINHGQNRALIQWGRLMRPDGSMIDVDSPSADPLGRAGVKGKVNSHFFARFGGAILQSALDIGVQLATRKVAGDTVILALPNSTQDLVTKPQDIKPTLTIKQGTSVSVFVARDLDFTTVEP